MRRLFSKLAVVICLFLATGFAMLAVGQGSQGVVPPHAVGVKPAPVQPDPPSSQVYAPQPTTPPYWTKLNNAPPVSLGHAAAH